MRQKTIILLCGLLLTAMTTDNIAAAGVKTPLTAGGFTLGTAISDYKFTSQENFIKEEIITDIQGFRKGFVTYGVCDRQGEILRIKLKYHDKSSSFFEKLLKQYKQKFGSKPKYVGGRFGNIKGWRWSFTDEKGQRVKLVLQHNLKNMDETIGSMMKLSLPDQLIAERKCFNKISDQSQGGDTDTFSKADWDLFLPK
jgi:hypothetical protein